MRYCCYELNCNSFEDLNKNINRGSSKLFGADIYRKGRRSITECARLARMPRTTFYRFLISNDLKMLCPKLYEDCCKVRDDHKHTGRLSAFRSKDKKQWRVNREY